MSRNIVVPRENEYKDYTEIPPYDYDLSHFGDFTILRELMKSPIEELYLGVTKQNNSDLFVLGLAELVAPEDKGAKAINEHNDDLLTKIADLSVDDAIKEIQSIASKDLGLKPTTNTEMGYLMYEWIGYREKHISKNLIKRLIELGADKKDIIFEQKYSTEILELSVGVSKEYQEPLKYFLPMLKRDGYTPVLVHSHPEITHVISQETQNIIDKNWEKLGYTSSHQYMDKLAADLRKQPSSEDLEMFRQIGGHGIGLLITKNAYNDYVFGPKNVHAFEVNDKMKKLAVRSSVPLEKPLINKYIKEFQEYKKNLKQNI